VRERIWAVVVRGRGVHEAGRAARELLVQGHGVAVERQGPVRRQGGDGDCQGGGRGLEVAARQGDCCRGVLGRGDVLAVGGGRVVDGADRDAHGGGGARQCIAQRACGFAAVRRCVREGIWAVVVRGRRVDQAGRTANKSLVQGHGV